MGLQGHIVWHGFTREIILLLGVKFTEFCKLVDARIVLNGGQASTIAKLAFCTIGTLPSLRMDQERQDESERTAMVQGRQVFSQAAFTGLTASHSSCFSP